MLRICCRLRAFNAASRTRWPEYSAPRLVCLHRRCYSVASSNVERFQVHFGQNESFPVDIYNASTSFSGPLLVYLPPSPEAHLAPIPAPLLSVPLVHPHIPWSSTTPFPYPLHALLAAYDWILHNLTNTPPTPTPTFPSYARQPISTPHTPRPIFIYASSLLAPLATSLALTESRTSTTSPSSQPLRGTISALAIHDGLYDFTSFIHPYHLPILRSSSGKRLVQSKDAKERALVSLLEHNTLARKLFRKPGQVFDPFVSPLLFFRTAGKDVPTSWDEPSSASSSNSQASAASSSRSSAWSDDSNVWTEDEWPSPDDPPAYPRPSSSSSSGGGGGIRTGMINLSPAPRKSHLRFPPRNSGLKIPYARLSVSNAKRDTVLAAQAREMEKVMRRSVVKFENGEGEGGSGGRARRRGVYGTLRGGDEDEMDDNDDDGEDGGDGTAGERVGCVDYEGRGGEGERAEDVMEWFDDVLR